MKSEMRNQVENEWKEYWQCQTNIPSWDYTSQIVLEALRGQSGTFLGKSVLESGCGTGRISLEIARSGARVTCIDISVEAVTHTQNIFTNAGMPHTVLVASTFELPFATAKFDIVWNAGVLEHFSEAERKEALRELLRVVKPGGLVITLNPYKFAVFYRIGKLIAEKWGKWPYGHEDPITSLIPTSSELFCTPARREYSIGFYLVLVESLRMSRTLLPLVKRLRALFVRAHRSVLGGVIRSSDRFFSLIFGGYLLVSGFRKDQCELIGSHDGNLSASRIR